MRILVIGSGAREHALLVSLAADPAVTELHAAPGNPGMVQARCHDAAVTDPAAVTELARKLAVDLVVIGPEVPLVAGVGDAVRAAGIPVFGPNAEAARIEGSKAFAKDVMAAAGVRTARAEIVDSPADLDDALERFGPTWVVKDDGLAAGKGVVVTPDRAAARAHALACLDDGHPVLLESFLDGPEVSLFCLVDGETVVPLLPAQDHKRVGEGDRGPNTGGMGAYAPAPVCPPELILPAPSSSKKVFRTTCRTRPAVRTSSPTLLVPVPPCTPLWPGVSPPPMERLLIVRGFSKVPAEKLWDNVSMKRSPSAFTRSRPVTAAASPTPGGVDGVSTRIPQARSGLSM